MKRIKKQKLVSCMMLSVFIIILCAGCSTSDKVITKNPFNKRKYQNGWYVNFLNNKNNVKPIIGNELPQQMVTKSFYKQYEEGTIVNELTNVQYASIQTDIKPIKKEAIQFIRAHRRILKDLKSSKNELKCDIIIFKSGEEIKVKIEEIGDDEVKYKMCDNLEGPVYIKNTDKIFKINYANGTSTIMSETNSKSEDSYGILGDSGIASGKDQLIALLLAIFFGYLGIHRMYLGHIGMGVLYLLTGGLCGIGYLVDIILILTGNLKPKKGEYEKTL